MAIQVSIDVQIGNALRALKEFEKKIKDLSKEAFTGPKDVSALKGVLSETKALKKDLALLAKQTKDTFGVFDAKEPLKALSAIEKKIEKIVTVGASKVSVGMAKKLKEPFEETTLAVNKTKKSIENVIATQKNLAKSTAYLADPLTKKFSILKSPFQGVDAQIKSITTSTVALSGRLTALQTVMATRKDYPYLNTTAFQVNQTKAAVAEIANIQKEMGRLSSTMSKQPLFATPETVGQLDNLKAQFKEVSKEYENLRKPKKFPPLIANDVIGNVKEFQARLSTFDGSLAAIRSRVSAKGFGFNKEAINKELANIEVLKGSLKDISMFAQKRGVSREIRIANLTPFTQQFQMLQTQIKNAEKEATKATQKIQAEFNRLKIGRLHLNLDGARESWRGFVKFFHENAYNIGSAMMSVGRNITMYFSAPLALAAGYALRASGQFETAQVAFKALTDTATEGKYIFEELRDFSKVAPVDVNALFEGAKQMLGLGFAAKEVVPTLKIISEGLGAIGADAGVFSRIVLALSQIKGKGRLMAEEIRQIGNVGLISMVKVAEKFKLNVSDFLKKVEERAISGEQAVGAVMSVITDRFSGFLELQAKTLPGRWKILTNHFKIFAAEFGTVLSGAFRVPENLTRLTAVLSFLTDKVKNMNPVVLELTLKISGLVVAFGLLLTVLGGLVKMYSVLQGLWVLAFTNPVTAVIAVLFLLIGTIALLVSTMKINWKLALQDMESAWKKWADELGSHIPDWVNNTISWIGSIFDSIQKHLDETLKGVPEYAPNDPRKFKVKGKGEVEINNFVGPPKPPWYQKYIIPAPDLMESATGLEAEQRKELERQTKEIMEAAKNFEGVVNDIGNATEKLADAQKALAANLTESDAKVKALGDRFNVASAYAQAYSTHIDALSKIADKSTIAQKEMAEAAELMADLEISGELIDVFRKMSKESIGAKIHFEQFGDATKYTKKQLDIFEDVIADLTNLLVKDPGNIVILQLLKQMTTNMQEFQQEASVGMIQKIGELRTEITNLGGDLPAFIAEFEAQNEELIESGNNYKILTALVQAYIKEAKKARKEDRTDIAKVKDIQDTLQQELALHEKLGKVLSGLYDKPTKQIESYKKAIDGFIALNKTIPQELIDEYNELILAQEAYKQKLEAVGTVIKSIWEGTTETFESAWKSAASSFVDKMLEVKMSGQTTAKAIQVAFASSVWGIIAMLASIAIQKVFTKPVKVELLATKLDKVFDEFIVNFKSALGEFRDILFSPKDEAAALFKTIETSFKGLNQSGALIAALKGKAFKGYGEANGGTGSWWNKLNPEKTEQLSSNWGRISSFANTPMVSANLYNAEKSKGYVIATTESRRAIDALNETLKALDIKEIGSKKLWAGAGDPLNWKKAFKIEDIENAFVAITKKLGESATEMAEVMNASFSKIKSLAEETVAIYKEKLDFTKDMGEAISDIKRGMLTTPELFKEQQKDVLTLSKGLADFLDPQTQLSKINKIKEAGYAIEVQEKRISDLKIDDARLTLDMIQEVKDANLDLWETVKTLISETFDLINQKAGFTQSIEDAIKDIKRSALSPTELYNEQLKDVNTILNQIASTADEQAKLPLYDKLREAYQTAYATAQQIYNPASIRSELEGLYKRSTTETNLESLKDIGNQIQGLKSDLVTAESGSKKAMDFAIKGLTALREQGGTSYDKLVAVNLDALGIQGDSSTWLEQLNKATGDWQTVIEANLKDLTKSGASAYDVLIAENLALLNINTMQFDVQTQMADYLSVIETNMIYALGSLQLMALNSSKAITSADVADLMGMSVEAMDAILGDSSPLMYLLSNLTTSMDDLFKTPATTETIPKLAKGGIVTSPTLAIIGEKGPEAVIPLSGKMLPRIETEYNSMDKELESLAKIALGGNTPQAKKDKKRGLISNAYENLGFSKVAKEMSTIFKTFRDIPKLAMGGVVTKPTLAMIGESGAEAVIPLNQMKQANVNINIEGAMVMDEITMSKWTRTLTKQIQKQQMRYA